MKSEVFLLPLFALGIIGMSLPVRPQADVETRDGREDARSKMMAIDTLSPFNVKRLDPTDGLGATGEASTDKAEATLATSLSTYSTSSDSSIFELEGLLKRNINAVRRTIKLSLKSAVHGITGTFTWVVQLSISPNQQKSWLGPLRLGARALFDPDGSSSGTSATAFDAKQLHHSARYWITEWKLELDYSSSLGKLLPVINWQEGFETFAGVWGADTGRIESTGLQWEMNGQVDTIDPANYDITIGT